MLETLPIASDQPRNAAPGTTPWLALAHQHRLTSDDAVSLERALRLGLPLASRNRALKQAARLEGVPLIPA